MQKVKLNDNAPAIAKDLDKSFPAWTPEADLVRMARRSGGIFGAGQCVYSYMASKGIVLDRKRINKVTYYRLAGYEISTSSYIDTAKRRIKVDPMAAIISLSFSDLLKRFSD